MAKNNIGINPGTPAGEEFSDAELEAYLDEALDSAQLARIEDAVRQSPALAQRLTTISARRDAGLHSLGEIWRRHRLTCLSRAELGSHLLGGLSDEQARYVAFHIQVVGCRLCQANLADLESQQAEVEDATQHRRQRYFQSSAGLLR